MITFKSIRNKLPSFKFSKHKINPISRSQSRDMFKEVAVFQVWDELAIETDEILKLLGKSRKDLKALEFDDEISAALETRLDALIGTPYRFEGDEAAVEFIEEQLAFRVPDLLTAFFNARLYGYSVVETVYEKLDNQIVLAKAQEKPFHWFEPKRTGELLFHGETGLGLGVEVDTNKFILTQCKATYDNPMGVAMLSKLYWPAYYKKYGWQFWLKWLERYGFPSRIGTTPSGFLDDGVTTRAEDLANALQAMAQNSTAVISDDQKVEVSEPSSGGVHFDTIDDKINKRIQKTILGQTLTTDITGSTGSFAAAKVHQEVKDGRRLSDVRLSVHSVQKIVNILMFYNFPNQVVDFIMEDERGLEIERATRDKILIDAGAIKLTEDYLLDRYDFNQGDFTIPEDIQNTNEDNPEDDDLKPTVKDKTKKIKDTKEDKEARKEAQKKSVGASNIHY